MSLEGEKTERPVQSFGELEALIGQTASCAEVWHDTNPQTGEPVYERMDGKPRLSGPVRKISEDRYSIDDPAYFVEVDRGNFGARDVRVEE